MPVAFFRNGKCVADLSEDRGGDRPICGSSVGFRIVGCQGVRFRVSGVKCRIKSFGFKGKDIGFEVWGWGV